MRIANWITTVLLAGAATAQIQSTGFTNVPITDEGTLDLVTGVITPPLGGVLPASVGVVYDNTCLPFAPAVGSGGCGVVYVDPYMNAGKSVIDDGRLPSTTSTAPAVGVMNAYRITQFRIIYYSSEQDPSIGGPGVRLTVRFWQDLDTCQSLSSAPVATATFNLTLPGSNVPLQTQGHAININLAGGMEFTLKADANGSFDNNPSLDTFGYGFSVITITPGEQTAITRAGQPNSGSLNPCSVGDATYYQNPSSSAGTGLGNTNQFWFQQSPSFGSCQTGSNSVTPCTGISGPEWGGFYMRMWADLTDCNGNALPDHDDIASGFSQDANANGIPDECEATPVVNYCTGGTTLNGCVAAMSATGSPSVSTASGFIVHCNTVEGQKQGIIFYGTSTAIASPWGTSSSYLCVKAPTQRTGVQNTAGTLNACDGAMSLDFFAYLSSNPSALGNPFSSGQKAFLQGWFRDQGSSKTTSLSDALEVTFLP